MLPAILDETAPVGAADGAAAAAAPPADPRDVIACFDVMEHEWSGGRNGLAAPPLAAKF